jgi:hypothetical protein
MRSTCKLVLGAIVAVSVWGGAQAQELTDFERQYADALVQVLISWEKGDIEFRRSDFADEFFGVRLDRFQQRQSQRDLEKIIPLDFIEANWDRLPETVKSEQPLSRGAYQVLIGGIVDAAPQLLERGIEAKPAALVAELGFPLFVTLAAAQEEAKSAGTEQTDSVAIRRGGLWFFSLGWPFCCAEEP